MSSTLQEASVADPIMPILSMTRKASVVKSDNAAAIDNEGRNQI